MFELAITQRELGNLPRAVAGLRKVTMDRTTMLGYDHPDSLSARLELNVTTFQLKPWKNAKQETSQIPKLYTKILGPDHPDSVRSRKNFLDVYGEDSSSLLEEARG